MLERVEVEYITMPGWKTSIAHAKFISDLPPNAKAYVEKLWELIGVQGTCLCTTCTCLNQCMTLCTVFKIAVYIYFDNY